MQLIVGQKVAYPNQGVCLVEEFKQRTVGARNLSGYSLRVLGDNSTIFVPQENADSVSLRPVSSTSQCRKLINRLSENFGPVSGDWKTRSRLFTEKLRSGDVFEAAEVLKMLTFLSREKKLSFREQTLMEKAKFLIVSELANADPAKKAAIEDKVVTLVEAACFKHTATESAAMAAVH